jgi:imidazolonepropionase-like amidohydrolase
MQNRLLLAAGAAAAVVVAGTLAVRAQTPPVPPAPLMLTNASVVDVATGEIRRGQTIVLRDGRIVSLGTAAPPFGTAPPRVDLGGRYVVPGLIDAHVHIATAAAMRAALESGVTTARSAGVSHFEDVGLRDLVRKGYLPEAFLDAPDLGDLMQGLTTPDALRRFVRFNLGRGADWIKVLATERAGTPDTDPRKQVYTEAELALVVSEAGARGAAVLAHAHGAEGALAAVRAGVRSIEHGTYLTDETLKLMVAKNTYFVPTADVVNDLAEAGGDYDHAGLQRRGQMMKPVLVETIRRARAAGVKIVTGSDTAYGTASMARVPREVLELIEAGLPALAALQAATSLNAEMLRLETQVGALKPGFEADLVVVDANPLERPRTLLDPLYVVSNGRVALDRLSFGR